MKRKTFVSMALLIGSVTMLAGCKFTFRYIVPAYPFDDTLPDSDDDGGTFKIKVWCDERIKDSITGQINQFAALNGGKYVLDLKVDPVSEGSAANNMLNDVDSGPDIYCFAQDQLSRLKIAGGLSEITGSIAGTIRKDNMKGAVDAASFNNSLYAFPLTSDNGYFMYYDKRVIPEDHIHDMGKIIQDCVAAKKKMNYKVFADGFYSASYFMATGCESTWTIDNATGMFTAYNDTYHQYALPAMKALRELRQAGIISPNDATNKLGDTAAVAISGIWNYAAAVKALGDNLGCCEMPSFTVDGKTYHISSFSGYKLMGVKPQTDPKKLSVCKKIAAYLTGEKCQLERFNAVGWGPSNINASKNEKVQAQPGLNALFTQAEYAKPQGICPGSWFSNVQTLAFAIKDTTTDPEFESFLNIYDSNLPGLLDD